jgi:hypothetical protein
MNFLQLNPRLMRHVIEWSKTGLPYRIATLEKALIDTFYIATHKRPCFAALPQLELQRAPSYKKDSGNYWIDMNFRSERNASSAKDEAHNQAVVIRENTAFVPLMCF